MFTIENEIRRVYKDAQKEWVSKNAIQLSI